MVAVERYPTLAEAARSMGQGKAYLGGGTLLMRGVNYGAQDVGTLIRSTDPTLSDIRAEGDRIRIGAGVTMAQLIASRDTAVLAQVARVVGGPAIRNMATVGGNLFAPHPYGDLTTALLALDAQVIWADGRADPIEAMLAARQDARGLVAAVTIPRAQPGDLRWRKVSRVKPKGVSVMSIAAWTPPMGQITRIAFNGMGPSPVRALAAERALGGRIDATTVQAACAVATDGLDPPDDPLASAWYRREVAPVHLRRCLLGEP